MDIAQHAAIKKDISVAIFSMEMPKEQIAFENVIVSFQELVKLIYAKDK